MNNSKKLGVIIAIVVGVLVVAVGGYCLLTAPKTYHEGQLSFKLPNGFQNKGTQYVKEFYDNPFAGGTVYCTVRVESGTKSQSSYDSALTSSKNLYRGNANTKVINGVKWDYVSGTSNSASSTSSVYVYLTLDNSNYYQVTITNSDEHPCSTKDINTIINSLKIN